MKRLPQETMHSHSSSNLAICLTSKDLDRTSAIGSTAFNNYWFTTNNATPLWKASNTITYHQPCNLTNIDEEKQPFSFVILETRMIKFAQAHYKETVAELTETCPNQGVLNYKNLIENCPK
jgi:hypothetical protein